MEKKIRTLGVLYGKSFRVDLDEVERPSGALARRIAIRHPSAVSVVPVLPDGRTIVVRQFRYAYGMETVEFPAGKIDPGEIPNQTAVRETLEETGRRPGRVEKLLSFAPSVGYSDETIHIFAAYDLSGAEFRPHGDEIAGVEEVAFEDLRKMAQSGEIVDGTTLVTLAVWEWFKGGAID